MKLWTIYESKADDNPIALKYLPSSEKSFRSKFGSVPSPADVYIIKGNDAARSAITKLKELRRQDSELSSRAR